METILAYPCRRPNCTKPARKGKSCCSQECRDKVPNCHKEGCTNAVEMGWSHGATTPGPYCYNCGGRFHFDGDPQPDINPSKCKYIKTVEGWKMV
jgi:hypothetical protein